MRHNGEIACRVTFDIREKQEEIMNRFRGVKIL